MTDTPDIEARRKLADDFHSATISEEGLDFGWLRGNRDAILSALRDDRFAEGREAGLRHGVKIAAEFEDEFRKLAPNEHTERYLTRAWTCKKIGENILALITPDKSPQSTTTESEQ